MRSIRAIAGVIALLAITNCHKSSKSSPSTPPYDPSSVELVQLARESGKIDEKTEAYYELLAQFAPGRLPAEYQAARTLASLPSVAPMRIAMQHLAEYTDAQAAEIKAMLALPHEPGWMTFPAVSRVGTLRRALSSSAPATGGPQSCRAAFAATTQATALSHFVGAPLIDTAHFRIRGMLLDPSDAKEKTALTNRLNAALATTVPDVGGGREVAFGDYLDHVYDYYANTLGMRGPSQLLAPKADGGRVPIDVAICDGAVNDAFGEPDSGYVFASVQLAFEDPVFRRITLPHELFHVFQATYAAPKDQASSWVLEATAVAAEDLVAPDVRRWSGAYADTPILAAGFANPMDRSFKCPEEPIHSALQGRCRNRAPLATASFDGGYSRFALMKFLMRNHGLTLGDFWSVFDGAQGDATVLIPPEQLGEFQVALLGDPVAPGLLFFDAADRAAFTSGGPQGSDDAPTYVDDRWTFRLDAGKVRASRAFRLTPTDVASTASTLKSLDATAWPIQPGATHRILIEIPPEVAALAEMGATADGLRLHLELTGCDTCTINVVAHGVFTWSGPSAATTPDLTLVPSTTCGGTASAAASYGSVDCAIPQGHPIPQFLTAVISNFGGKAASWKGGLTLEQACMKGCADQYEASLGKAGCSPGDLRTKLDAGYCSFLCTAAPVSLGAPYCSSADVSCDRRQEVCANGGVSTDTIAAFVPITSWPAVQCQDLDCTCSDTGILVSGYTDTYVAGSYAQQAFYWRGGQAPMLFDLSDPGGLSTRATGIARVGNDVYVSGSLAFPGLSALQGQGVYWINGSSGRAIYNSWKMFSQGITSNNGHTYIGGSSCFASVCNPNPVQPAYWTIGQSTSKVLSSYGYLHDLVATDDGVYAVGQDMAKGHVWWKDNGSTVEEHQLPYASGDFDLQCYFGERTGSSSSSLTVHGADVYVGGFSFSSSDLVQSLKPGYWKNSVFQAFPFMVGSCYSTIPSIAVSNGAVYVYGTCETSGVVHPCYFVNGTQHDLPNPPPYNMCFASDRHGIAVSGGNVYAIGSCCDDIDHCTHAYVWTNDNPTWMGITPPPGSGGPVNVYLTGVVAP
jgi:hypothetical protein